MNALIVPMPGHRAGPVGRVASSVTLSAIRSTSSGQVRTVVPSIDDRAVPAGRHRVAQQPRGDLVDDHRVLVALVLDVGEHVRQQLAARRTRPASTRRRSPRDVRPVTCGRPVWSPGIGGAKNPTEPNGLASRPSRAYVGPQVVVEPDVGLVEEQQVLALDGEDQRLRVDGPGAERAGGEQRVQQEQGEAGLGRDAGDARRWRRARRGCRRGTRG